MGEFYKEVYVKTKGKIRVMFVEREKCKIRVYHGIYSDQLHVSKWVSFPRLVETRKKIKSIYQTARDYFGYVDSIQEAENPPYGIKHVPFMKFDICFHKAEPPIFVYKSKGGIRVIITQHGLFYRNGKKYATIDSFNHGALKPFFKKNPNVILEGELYSLRYRENGRVRFSRDQFLRKVRRTKRPVRCRLDIYDGFGLMSSDRDVYSYRMQRIKEVFKETDEIKIPEPRRFDSGGYAFIELRKEAHKYGYIIKSSNSEYRKTPYYGSQFYETRPYKTFKFKHFLRNEFGVPSHVITYNGKKFPIAESYTLRTYWVKPEREGLFKGEHIRIYLNEDENIEKGKFYLKDSIHFDFYL